MKKLKIMISFIIIMAGLFFVNIFVYANTKFDIYVDYQKNNIETVNPKKIKNKSNFKTYELISEIGQSIAYHLISTTDELNIILYKHETEDRYLLEGILFDEEIKTCLKEITREEYDYLSNESEQVLNTSKLGQQLMSNQSSFEDNYQYEVFDYGIQPYSIQRNDKSVHQMTSTDSYLKAYYSIYEGDQYFQRKYCDNIINLIPEEYFYQEGIYTYVGEEYAFLIETLPGYSVTQFNHCYICNVCIYDITTRLPFLSKMSDGDPSVNGVQMSNNLELSIKPYLIRTYYAYDRQYCNETVWKNNFDTTEKHVIVARFDCHKRFYIAPQTFGLGVTEESYCTCGENQIKISQLEYKMKVDEIALYHNTSEFAKNVFLNLSSASLSEFPGGKMIDLVKTIVVDFLDYYNKSEKSETRDLYKEFGRLYYKANYDRDLNLMPTSTIINHPSYYTVFSENAILEYEHHYQVKLTVRGNLPNHYFDTKMYGLFDFYNNSGGLVATNIEREYLIKGLNFNINSINEEGSDPIPHPLQESNWIQGNIGVAGKSENILFKAPSTGLYTISFYPVKSFVIAKVCDKNGQVLQSNEGCEEYTSDLLVNLEENEFYFLNIRLLSKSDTSSVGIKFTKWFSNNEINLGDSTNIYHLTQNYIYDTFWFEFNLTIPGVYIFFTSSSEDTTIQIYSEECGLLAESFNPFANWSDEDPDLNAFCELYSRKSQRKIIVSITVRAQCSLTFFTMYRSSSL